MATRLLMPQRLTELEAVNQIDSGDLGAPEPCASGMLRPGAENGENAGSGWVEIRRGFGMTFSSLGSTITVPKLV